MGGWVNVEGGYLGEGTGLEEAGTRNGLGRWRGDSVLAVRA